MRTKHVCNVCDKTPVKSKCSECLRTYYCSRKCQVQDWKIHKQDCVQGYIDTVYKQFIDVELIEYDLYVAVLLREFLQQRGIVTTIVYGFMILNNDVAIEQVWLNNEKQRQFICTFVPSISKNLSLCIHDYEFTCDVPLHVKPMYMNYARNDNTSGKSRELLELVKNDKIETFLRKLPHPCYRVYETLCGNPTKR